MERCIRLYDYQAQDSASEELIIQKNEGLVVVDDSGTWWRVQNDHGDLGLVPSNYVKKQAQKPLPQQSERSKVEEQPGQYHQPDLTVPSQRNGPSLNIRAVAKYKYASTQEDELSLEKGDDVIVMEKEADGWWRGRCGVKIGWFPFNYVEEVGPQANDLVSEPELNQTKLEEQPALHYNPVEVKQPPPSTETRPDMPPPVPPKTYHGYAASVIEMLLMRSGDVEPNPGPTGGLGPDDVLTVLEELRKVRAKWENIGLGLDVAPGTLEAIKLQYQDPLDCLREVLREWLKSLPGPSWEGLVQVLRRPAIGEQSLARELVTKFCSQSETLESPPDGGLGPKDLLTVLDELHEFQAKWEKIGLGLGVTRGILEAIKLQYQDPLDCLRAVLREWLKSLPGPSWEGLVQVLRRPAIGERSLATKLEMKFCPLPETPPACAPCPTLRDLDQLKFSDWYGVGLQLGVDEGTLDEIEVDCPRLREKRRAMFQAWLRESPGASYADLARALFLAEEETLAHQLCQRHGIPVSA